MRPTRQDQWGRIKDFCRHASATSVAPRLTIDCSSMRFRTVPSRILARSAEAFWELEGGLSLKPVGEQSEFSSAFSSIGSDHDEYTMIDPAIVRASRQR